MKTRIQTIFRRVALLAAIAGIVSLGNLRTPTAAAFSAPGSKDSETSVRAKEVKRIVGHRAVLDADVDGVSGRSFDLPNEEGSVVPAIFARDQDVQFVYHHHVSKWT